jgi:putative FmdB family regulatory protein
MPTYEYECKKCGTVFDVYQSIKSTPLRKALCEKCGEVQPVRRLISTGGAVLFKGSGFYQTDYRSDHYKEKAKSESPAKDKAGGDKTDTKKAATSDTVKSTGTETKSTPASPKDSDKK